MRLWPFKPPLAPCQKRITISSCDRLADPALLRVTGGELFDRIVEKGSYSEKDAADLIKQVKRIFLINMNQGLLSELDSLILF